MFSTEMSVQQLFVLSYVLAATCVAAGSNMKEVCQWQTFEASCGEDEVVVIKDARYGRMRVGKCLSRNYFVGCSADVSAYMHGRCSGRQHCRVAVPDPVMFAAQPCPRDLVAYLEADYECVKVAKWNEEACDKVMTAPTGLIAKPADTVTDIRKKHHCPRRIVAQPGQTINVYLSDFYLAHHRHHQSSDATTATATTTSSAPVVPECIPYGHVAEDGTSAPARICGGEFKKNQLVYRSSSNVVDITLTAPTSHSHHYLIKYEVVGCPTLEAPENGFIQIVKDTAVVRCNNSRTISELVCSGNQWVGEMQNCTNYEMPMAGSVSSMPFADLFANTGLLVAVSIGVALGVLVGIGLLVFAITLFSARKPVLVQQLPADQQTSQTNLLKKSFNQDSTPSGLDAYHYLPVMEAQYQHVHLPVSASDVDYPTKSFLPAQPVHHIVNHLYEAPRSGDLSTLRDARVSMTTFGNYATTLDSRVPARENAYGPLGGMCAEHQGLTITEVDAALPIYNVYDITGLSAAHGRDNVIVMDDAAY